MPSKEQKRKAKLRKKLEEVQEHFYDPLAYSGHNDSAGQMLHAPNQSVYDMVKAYAAFVNSTGKGPLMAIADACENRTWKKKHVEKTRAELQQLMDDHS